MHSSAALNPTAMATLLRRTPRERAAATTLPALSRYRKKPRARLDPSAGVRPRDTTLNRRSASRGCNTATASESSRDRHQAMPHSSDDTTMVVPLVALCTGQGGAVVRHQAGAAWGSLPAVDSISHSRTRGRPLANRTTDRYQSRVSSILGHWARHRRGPRLCSLRQQLASEASVMLIAVCASQTQKSASLPSLDTLSDPMTVKETKAFAFLQQQNLARVRHRPLSH